ncbi:hypothetical protein SAMD00019534_042180 [Acytostelium subglobosum LB1]|uniref:hypothetical protein n=1 Tax=Acytostelium subglobosum LB1 TaxID=1410327 RepID=UPI0006449064|nr:hypothetical protein SAMD00019534_042180 [Acytostelium subglobosum LB1]GAM21043.1 hypothetical protein SAMD00019534_042180 [Acytostelium subglobosum LB1]|eukprot:XP_012756177.1 hypothetical protein SAMD00019534_042180 [Acytostelium subglobosum LB1]
MFGKRSPSSDVDEEDHYHHHVISPNNSDDYDDVNDDNDVLDQYADDDDEDIVPNHILAEDYTTQELEDNDDILKDIRVEDLRLLQHKDGTPYTSLEELIKDVHEDPHHTLKISIGIDKELQSLPLGVISTYLGQAEQLVHLHRVITENDRILAEIGDVFKQFDDELQALLKDMPDNHITSLQIGQALENRMIVRESISKLVKKIVIPPDLINGLFDDEMNEEYVQNIEHLERIIQNLDEYMSSSAMFAQDMAFEIDLLKKKASRSVRDFMMKLVISLRKPRTNVQILQHSKLFKYSILNQFIYKYAPTFAKEIKNTYVETVSRIFTSYFKNYLTSLSKVFYPIGSKSDVVGYYDNIVKGYFGSTSTKQVDTNKPSAFNLNISNLPNDIWTSIRSEVINEIPEKINQNLLRRSHIIIRATDAPLIIPHVALKHNNKRYPFEQIFRSMNILLLDTVCSEYIFDQQWFAKPLVNNSESSGIIKPIFERIFNAFYENIGYYVTNSFDCLGVLISIKLNQMFINMVAERRLDIPCLKSYFYQVDTILWDKFSELFKRNIDSLKAALTNNNGTIDLRPHIYTRRFSEFYASVSEVVGLDTSDSRVTAWMAVLRSSMERVLEHLANNFPNNKTKSMFLINNYDVVLTVLSENNISHKEEGYAKFRSLLDEQVMVFIEEQLYSYLKPLISFIKDTESKLLNPTANNQPFIIDKDVLSNLITDFGQRWRDVLQKIQMDIMTNFSNFNQGSDITRKLITQFLIYYKRFEEIHKKSKHQQSSSTQQPPPSSNAKPVATFIPISTITYEISKSYASFS